MRKQLAAQGWKPAAPVGPRVRSLRDLKKKTADSFSLQTIAVPFQLPPHPMAGDLNAHYHEAWQKNKIPGAGTSSISARALASFCLVQGSPWRW